MALETFQGGLQARFRPCPDQRLGQEVMVVQSPESSNWDSFGTPLWESRDKKPFGCSPVDERKEYYMGEGGGFP